MKGFSLILISSFILGVCITSFHFTISQSSVTISAQVNSSGTSTPPTPPSGGGSGGGGFSSSPFGSGQAVFSGKAYPGSLVSLLKDGTLVAKVPASADATFQINAANLSAGSFNFGVLSQDSNGVSSAMQTFPISISENITTYVSDIFIAPTLSADKSQVKQGDILSLFGQSVPTAQITLMIHSANEIVKKVTSAKNGAWLFKFDTNEVEKGDHTAASRAAQAEDFSGLSQEVAFKVGDVNVLNPVKKNLIGDLNKDGKVNIVDFSILAYWYKRAAPPAYVDLNNDGKISLIDFSIIAYYWTG